MSARLSRALLRHPLTHRIIALLVSVWLRFVYVTSRKTLLIAPEAAPYAAGEKQAIFCFWHGRMIVMPFLKPKRRTMHVLISNHRDGTLISAIIACFGLRTVRGSSSKGGASAMRAMQALIASGDNFCITPDGPRGPRHVAAKGAAFLAKHSALPLIPAAFSATRAHVFSSWDQFMLPLPFSRIVMRLNAPVNVETVDLRYALEEAINKVTSQCDQAVER